MRSWQSVLAVLWTVGVGLVLLYGPVMASHAQHVSSSGVSHASGTTYGLAAAEGSVAYLLVAFPFLAALIPCLMCGERRIRAANAIGSALMGVFVVVTSTSIGVFYAPAFILLLFRALTATQRPPQTN